MMTLAEKWELRPDGTNPTRKWSATPAGAGSGISRKSIPLGSAALAVLEAAPRKLSSAWVIPGRSAAGPMTPAHLGRAWDRIRQRAGLPGVHLHDLRHSFASVGTGSRLSLKIIGALLGHKDVATTNRYAHLAVDPFLEAAEEVSSKVARALAGGVASRETVRSDARRDSLPERSRAAKGVPAPGALHGAALTRASPRWSHAVGPTPLPSWWQATVYGSSPLARGTRIVESRQFIESRIIPARAGNTAPSCRSTGTRTDHPRSRGENRSVGRGSERRTGSSPLARGTHLDFAMWRSGARIIPARAGNTRCPLRPSWARSDHPRSRGEHL